MTVRPHATGALPLEQQLADTRRNIRRIYRRAMLAYALIFAVAAIAFVFVWPLLAVIAAWWSGYAWVHARSGTSTHE